MTTPKKGDLVIVREKRGAFKKDVLYLAECVIGHGYHIVGLERLSDRLPIVVDVDAHSDSRFTIEEVIPKEKLPKEITKPQPGHFVPTEELERLRDQEARRSNMLDAWMRAVMYNPPHWKDWNKPAVPTDFLQTDSDRLRSELVAKWAKKVYDKYKP